MKFPRNARILRSQLDAAPLAAVFFLLVIFVMMGSLVYTPGVHIELPVAETGSGNNDLPGTDRPPITIAVDANNRLFHANQLISERELKVRLARAVANSPEPPTLIIQAHKAVTLEHYTRLTLLARDAGIRKSLLATVPRPAATRAKP
jgi:biopolymer transport protein ExbD